MNYFTTRETHLFPSFRLDAKEQEKLDRFLLLLDRSEVAELFPLKDMNEIKSGGRPHYSYYDLFAVILYGFAFSSGTLRDLEDSCRFDLRYIYLMQENMPSYVVFAEMINTLILPNRKEIFKRILKAILKETGVTVEDLFIDGSKFEADANKYKFVWKPTTYHLNLSDKIRFLLNEAGLSRSVPEKGILPSSLIADKLTVLIAKAKEYKY